MNLADEINEVLNETTLIDGAEQLVEPAGQDRGDGVGQSTSACVGASEATGVTRLKLAAVWSIGT